MVHTTFTDRGRCNITTELGPVLITVEQESVLIGLPVVYKTRYGGPVRFTGERKRVNGTYLYIPDNRCLTINSRCP